jgi:hypothetical protein
MTTISAQANTDRALANVPGTRMATELLKGRPDIDDYSTSQSTASTKLE